MNQKQVDEILKTLIDEKTISSKPKEADSLKKGVREMIMMTNSTRVFETKREEKEKDKRYKKTP